MISDNTITFITHVSANQEGSTYNWIGLFKLYPINAQNCKHVKEKKDAFTNKVIRTANIAIYSWEIVMQHNADEYYVGMNISYDGLIKESLVEGHKISFKFENNDVFDLSLDKDYEPILDVMANTTKTRWKVLVKVDKKTFANFSRSLITAIRTTIHGEDKVLEIGARAGGRIQDTFSCLLQDS